MQQGQPDIRRVIRDVRGLDLGPNAALIGEPGSRNLLATPCLVLDRPRLDANIAAGARIATARGKALRPHGKTHKCAEIARRQIVAGARGVCVATVGEAEALAADGIGDILITSTFTQPGKFARAVALATGGTKIALVADDPGVVDQLAAVAAAAGVTLDVYVDVDLGRRRNGVTTIEQALAVAGAIAAATQLRLAGVQTYASHISHVENHAERLAASQECAQRIEAIRDALTAAGHRIGTVTGGSTGTLFIDTLLPCYTELQAGSYVFNDAEYLTIDFDGKGIQAFAPSLFVRVSVIGRNVAGRVTCDGGNKHFSAKGTLPAFAAAPAEGAVYRPDSDEHGIIELPAGAAQPALGANFELIVPHCDPTVNLYSHYHLVEGDTLIAIWPVDARGAF
jgi:D-serine deaminase-like pyridoxal phosphate-dependent protein